ncbi:MAG: YciI family protein [Arcanobacterium sp.]|nr:YciI family protein [Arcanobacterium sp.]MDY5589568.1 YciI family protein [Arcanobacterium sp.]
MEKIFAVHYLYDPQRTDDLARIRPEHRTFLRSLYEAGALLASGPLGSDEALIIVHAESVASALELLAPDPLNKAGVIATRTAQQWQPVIGPWE